MAVLDSGVQQGALFGAEESVISVILFSLFNLAMKYINGHMFLTTCPHHLRCILCHCVEGVNIFWLMRSTCLTLLVTDVAFIPRLLRFPRFATLTPYKYRTILPNC